MCHVLVFQPTTETLDLALRRSAATCVASLACRGFFGNSRQLDASSPDDSANQTSQSIQVACLIACVFGPRDLLERRKDRRERFLPSDMVSSPLYMFELEGF